MARHRHAIYTLWKPSHQLYLRTPLKRRLMRIAFQSRTVGSAGIRFAGLKAVSHALRWIDSRALRRTGQTIARLVVIALGLQMK
jgi:hypothetical protein